MNRENIIDFLFIITSPIWIWFYLIYVIFIYEPRDLEWEEFLRNNPEIKSNYKWPNNGVSNNE